MDWLSQIFAQQWLWGAVAGAGLAFFGQWIARESQNRAARRIAAMQIATQLRAWLTSCAGVVGGIRLHDDSGGQAGVLANQLPKLPFEDSMDRVSELKPKDAFAIFELIHGRDALHDVVAFVADMASPDDALDLLRGRAAEMYLDAMPIHARLTKQVGWKTDAFPPPWQVAMMREEVERARSTRAATADAIKIRRRAPAAVKTKK